MSQIQYIKYMGCGSSVAQVSDSIKEGLFKPIRLLEVEREGDPTEFEGRLFLFGETRTQRKIIELQLLKGNAKSVSSRVRIPVPRVTYDPIELMYEESQEIFHLGVYGLSVQPPFNRMLALTFQPNLIFLCGGRDFDGYNIKNDAFYYSIAEQSKENGELATKTETRHKYSANKFQKVSSMNVRRFGHMGIYIQKLKSVLVFGGVNEREEVISSCERYGALDNAWKEFAPMKVARAYGNCFQFSNKVYVFGGRSRPTKRSKKIEVYDLENHQWEILPFKIHRGIENAHIVSLNPNEIMIIGGVTDAGPTKSVIKVDISNQTYVWDSNLNNSYQAVKGIKTRSDIIVFGGAKYTMQAYSNGQWSIKSLDHKKHAQIEDMEIFSFSTQSLNVASRKDQFTEQAINVKENLILMGNDECPCLLVCSLREGTVRKCSVPMRCKIRSKMGIVEYEKGRYFLAGGCDWKEKKSFSSCYFYNAETNEAQETVKMNEKKHNFAICTLEGFIYIFGGYDSLDKTAKKSCAKFSLSNEGWDLLPTMRRARSRCHSVVLNSNKIAVFGGVSGHEPVAGIEILNIHERKFDIFEPSLQLSSNILCSYALPNNQNSIFILNGGIEGSEYELTTICLAPNHPMDASRSSTSNHPEVLEAPRKSTSLSSSSLRQGSDIYFEPISNQVGEPEDTNVIRIKPKFVQIEPKKLESESSQANLSQKKEPVDVAEPAEDLDPDFQIEKIDLRKNKTEAIVIEAKEESEAVKQEFGNNFVIQNEQPIDLGNTETNKQRSRVKIEPTKQLKQVAKEPEAPIQPIVKEKTEEQFKLISSKPIDWLNKGHSYLVAPRLEHIYFLTNASSLQLDKSTGKVLPLEFKNGTRVTIDMIR